MSKLPNHSFFTRTAAASSRSATASLLAHTTHRHRSTWISVRKFSPIHTARLHSHRHPYHIVRHSHPSRKLPSQQHDRNFHLFDNASPLDTLSYDPPSYASDILLTPSPALANVSAYDSLLSNSYQIDVGLLWGGPSDHHGSTCSTSSVAGFEPATATNLIHQMEALNLHTSVSSGVAVQLEAQTQTFPSSPRSSSGPAVPLYDSPSSSHSVGQRPPASDSKGSSSSSSSSSSSASTAHPNVASSTATQDTSSSGSTSGSATPSNPSSPNSLLDSAFFGSSTIASSAAIICTSANPILHSGPSDSQESWQHPELSPLLARAFSSPRNRSFNFTFEHGAYGIPKRHPWAAVKGKGKEKAKPASLSGAVGMLAAAADFLTGPVTPHAVEYEKKRLGSGVSSVGPDGRKRGLNSPIRENGQIVQDRLQSVQVGEDAYFLRPDSLGVADGVGGWASRPGADPALFSRLLMHFCAAELGKYDDLSTDRLVADGGKLLNEWRNVDPVEVMHTAWERCVRASRREGILGSSTALIALLRGDELRIANLGDCVLLIIRAGELLFRSTEQQHSFNFPVQLGMMGHTAESVSLAADRTLAREGYLHSGASNDLDDDLPNPLGTSAIPGDSKTSSSATSTNGEEVEWDEPRRDAGRWTVKVQKGDIIIVGSDGLVDNLFDEDIVEEVLKFAPLPPSRKGDAARSETSNGDAPVSNEEQWEEASSFFESRSGYSLPSDFSPQLVSEALCSRAKAVSEDSRAVSSPFQQRAMEEGYHYVGGKHDDISVVVAVVGDANEQISKQGWTSVSQMQDDEKNDASSHTSSTLTTQ